MRWNRNYPGKKKSWLAEDRLVASIEQGKGVAFGAGEISAGPVCLGRLSRQDSVDLYSRTRRRSHNVGVNDMLNVGAAQEVTVGGAHVQHVIHPHIVTAPSG